MSRIQQAESALFEYWALDASGAAVTGATITLKIRRTDTNQYWNGSIWTTVSTVNMTETDSSNFAGHYSYSVTAPSADTNLQGFADSANASIIDPERVLTIVVGGWADELDASVSSRGTTANQTTILNRLGAFTGSGVNTILGFFQAALRSDATTPSDLGGTYDDATDSLQAIRDRGDAAWITATGFSTHTAADVWAAGTRTLTASLDPTAATIADAVWDELATGHTDAGKAGQQLWTDIDAILADTDSLDTTKVTTARANNLDNLNATISSRSATGEYTAALAAIQADLDNPAQYQNDLSSIATLANQTTILSRLGAFSGSGTNTVLGFFQAVMRNDITIPSDLGGSYDDASHSLQAIRARGDATWITATGFSTHSAADVWAVGTRTLTASLDPTVGQINAAIEAGQVGTNAANAFRALVNDLIVTAGSPDTWKLYNDAGLGGGVTIAEGTRTTTQRIRTV